MATHSRPPENHSLKKCACGVIGPLFTVLVRLALSYGRLLVAHLSMYWFTHLVTVSLNQKSVCALLAFCYVMHFVNTCAAFSTFDVALLMLHARPTHAKRQVRRTRPDRQPADPSKETMEIRAHAR